MNEILEKRDWQYIDQLLEAACIIQDLKKDEEGRSTLVEHIYSLTLSKKIRTILRKMS